MKRLTHIIANAFLILLAASIAGCYTMLTHPTIVTETTGTSADSTFYESYETEITLFDNCLECHEANTLSFTSSGYVHSEEVTDDEVEETEVIDYYPTPFAYWEAGPRAEYYYSTPWWINEFYYQAPAVSRSGGDSDSDAGPSPSDYSTRRPSSTSSYLPSVRSGSSISTSAGSTSNASSVDKTAPQSSTRRSAADQSSTSKKTTSSGKSKAQSTPKKNTAKEE